MANEYMMVSSVTNVLSQATDWLIDLGENWIDTQLDDYQGIDTWEKCYKDSHRMS